MRMKPTYVVIGGGISGLAAAYQLCRRGHKVLLAESSTRFGGWIQSIPLGDGIVYETGPRTLRPTGESGRSTLLLLDELDMTGSAIAVPRTAKAARRRLVCIDNHLYPIKTGLSAFFFPHAPFYVPLLSVILKDLSTSRKACDDESLYDFTYRRFGKRIADNGIDPLCRGVTGGDAREISVKAIFRPLFEAEQNYGTVFGGMLRKVKLPEVDIKFSPHGTEHVDSTSPSVIRSRKEHWAVWSVNGGLQMLVEGLLRSLRSHQAELYLGTPCQRLEFRDGVAKVDLGRTTIQTRHVFSAVPAPALAGLLGEEHYVLKQLLNTIQSVDMGVVNLEYEGKVLKREAFGYLVPSHQGGRALGTVFDTCAFPQKNSTILTVMLGGRWFQSVFGDDPSSDDLLEAAKEEVELRLGIKVPPKRYHVSLHRGCIPQHTVGHYERLVGMRDYIRDHCLPLTIIGASYDGISVNDCIHHSRKAVNELNLV